MSYDSVENRKSSASKSARSTQAVGLLKLAEAALNRADDDLVVGATVEHDSAVRIGMMEALEEIEKAKVALGWIAD